MGFDANPVETFDYYEPRTADRFVIKPTKIGLYTFQPIITIVLPLT